MDQKWILNLVFLVYYQKMTAGAAGDPLVVKEGSPVEIHCGPTEKGSILVWFRVLDTGMEFIASFTNTGIKKSTAKNPVSVFSYTKIKQEIVILESFNSARDSGAYSCASLVRGNELTFGEVTRLAGEKIRGAKPTILLLTTTTTTSTSTKPSLLTAATACVCDNKKEESSPSMLCAPLILGPMIGGCVLLLLLLIITAVYCNKIRTRRCPHHYKRKPPVKAAGTHSDKRLIK